MSQKYYENTKRPKMEENQLARSYVSTREFMHFTGNSAEHLRFMREHVLGYVSICEITPKMLLHLSLKSCHNFT